MKKLLDILTLNLYNRRINKNKTKEKNMESPNYTSEMVEAMVATYSDAPTPATVAALAEEFDKKPASIRAKLVSLGVYKAQKRVVTKRGEPVVTKNELAEQIQAALGTDLALPSLVKVTKNDLHTLLAIIETTVQGLN